jgi:hypothetical protein
VTDANGVIGIGSPDSSGTSAIHTIRLPRSYRRYPLVVASVITGFAVATGIIAGVKRSGWDGRFTIYAIVLLAATLPLWYTGAANSRAFTRYGPDGIRTRRLGRLRECPWSQVQAISQQQFRSRGGTAHSIVITTTTGERFRLGVPTSGRASPGPRFTEQFDRIKACWRAAAGPDAAAGPGGAAAEPPAPVDDLTD